MAKQTHDVTFFLFNPAKPGPCEQYLLPHIVSRARRSPDRFLAVGAAWNGYAVGAAAISLDGNAAKLETLFVDPKARGHGVGSALLRLAAAEAEQRDADSLSLSYCLPEPELTAMDRAVGALGAEPSFRANIYTLDSAKFHDSPVFGWTLSPRFQPAPNVRRFRDLPREQIERLNENEEIPGFLRPAARRDLIDDSLSVAWMEDGEIASFLLTSHSGLRSYTALSGWRSDKAPGDAYVHLLSACANYCYYHAGGDFLYHLSPITSRSEEMVHAYVGDLCDRMEEHAAELWLPVEDGEE